MGTELAREDIMQQRLKNTGDRKVAQMVKIEKKKQMLLEKQFKKQQEKEFILQTKLALLDEKNIRKQSNVNLHVLNKSNNNYVDKLAYVQSALDNNLLRLDRENNVINTVEQHKESVEKEIERIEQERQKELEDNNTIQNILLQKKQTIQTALDELSDLRIKTNTEYDKLQ